ncbi:MAG: hypothetical protein L6R43_01505 [Planctomycetes bacterium]|nr:hypothetical protein [Planctomycetota bacterium]
MTAAAEGKGGDGGHGGGGHGGGGQGGGPSLHIFVNRRKFEESDGVKPQMTGAEIAALVGTPADIAVIRRDSGPDKDEIGVNQTVPIKSGDHFVVTRKVVEGGHAARPQ